MRLSHKPSNSTFGNTWHVAAETSSDTSISPPSMLSGKCIKELKNYICTYKKSQNIIHTTFNKLVNVKSKWGMLRNLACSTMGYYKEKKSIHEGLRPILLIRTEQLTIDFLNMGT